MKRILIALICGISAASFADETLTFEGTGLGQNVTLGGHHVGGVFAGQLKFNSTSLGHITSYCVDLDHFISKGQTYQVEILDSKNASQHYKDAGNILAAGHSMVNSNEKAAAMQIAIWEAVYDDGATADFGHGQLKITGGANNTLLADAAAFFAMKTTPGNAKYLRETCGVGQSQMTPVPEPVSMATFGIGLAALIRRKKARA